AGPAIRIAHRGGVGENGRRPEMIAPRVGRAWPARNSTSTMPTRGSSRSPPGNGRLPDFGNQSLLTPRYWMSGTCMPSTNAAIVVRPNEEKLPTSAAVNAGTISAGITIGSIVELIDATKIPSRPVITVDSTQFVPARKAGEHPSTTAPVSLAGAARVGGPERGDW